MITVHTDGSIYPNPGGPMGWGFVAVDEWGEITEQFGGAAAAAGNSNNRAEMTGMLIALQWLAGRQAKLFTDSQYVVNGMNVWCRAWATRGWSRPNKNTGLLEPIPNTELWKQLIVARSPSQHVGWVRGHNGTKHNERADALALQGRMSVTPATQH